VARLAALLAVGALGAAVSGTARAASPALHIELRPLVVAGVHFSPGERITVLVTYAPSKAAMRRARASKDGRFRVTFKKIDGIPRGLRVRATGSDGHATIWAPRPDRIAPPASRNS
jgi:hypothetical protein